MHPAAAVLALVPFVNLTYFVLVFVFAPANRLFPYLFCVAVGATAVFYLSNRFLPMGYEYLKFYMITVLLSTAAYFLLRSILILETKFPESAKLRLVIGIAIIMFLSLMWVLTSKAVDLQPQTEMMLQAIINENEDLFRTVSYENSLTLDSVQQALDEQDIDLQGAIRFVKTESLTVRGTKGDTTKIAEYIYQIGNEEFLVRVMYRSSGIKEGISELVIRKK